MTSVTSTDDITRADAARLVKRKHDREKAYDAEFDAFTRKVVERVRGLEARVRELEARVEVAETQRDAMRAELKAARSTLAEAKATRCDFSSLPLDVISTHFLRPDFLPEPGDLGRLRAVSKSMRDAVDATGRKIKKMSNWDAMWHGYVSFLKDRHSRGLLPDRERRCLCAGAARSGDLEELKALRADKWPRDVFTCASAATGGHLEVLKWLRANDCPWDEWTCTNAAWGGHLETLKWARANGCPWDEWTCYYAAQHGHLETLQWARENGAPWSEKTRELAAREGYVET